MIVTRLSGGLGNQMFQYAAGRRLALARGTELVLDPSPLSDPRVRTPRCYELGRYPIRARVGEPSEIDALERRRRSLTSRLARRLGRRPASVERGFGFDPAVLDLPDGSCLEGHWQSERYFADAADEVRAELSLETPPGENDAAWLARIASCSSVSVHVRRGDYVSDPAVLAMHGTCSLDYYVRACEHLAKRVADPVYFVFTDDPEWARSHLSLPGETAFVDHNGPDAGPEDLRLMSRCQHHIIANSTFSWWGAWLDPRPDKLVIAPRRWFQDDRRQTRDVVPDGWVRL